MIKKQVYILLVSVLVYACTADYTPKPLSYKRIDPYGRSWLKYTTSNFELEYVDVAKVSNIEATKEDNTIWFNIDYTQFGATIFCTYLPVSKQTIDAAFEDSYRLAYSHAGKAEAISSVLYESGSGTTSILYSIEGDVATPLQFLVTDSSTHFLRGSLYYSGVPNADSIAPLTSYIKEDIIHLIENIKWKSKPN